MLEPAAERTPSRRRLGERARRILLTGLSDRCLRRECRESIALGGRVDVVEQALGKVDVSCAARDPYGIA